VILIPIPLRSISIQQQLLLPLLQACWLGLFPILGASSSFALRQLRSSYLLAASFAQSAASRCFESASLANSVAVASKLAFSFRSASCGAALLCSCCIRIVAAILNCKLRSYILNCILQIANPLLRSSASRQLPLATSRLPTALPAALRLARSRSNLLCSLCLALPLCILSAALLACQLHAA